MTTISLATYHAMHGKKKAKAKTQRKRGGVKIESVGESTLAQHLKVLKIEFEREFQFCESRKWRSDFHITGTKLLIEVEGGIWSGGRHTRAKGYLRDMEKYNEATALGYQLLRFSTEQVKSGFAVKKIEQVLEGN
jgi:very-short-patch-repair endonuclease